MATTDSSRYSRNTAFDMQLKILTIGNAGVGKTCLMLRYTNNTYNDSYISTIGVDFHIKSIDVQGKKLRVQIWDTAGQERFRTITTSFFRGAQGILLVYDIMDRGSFTGIHAWIKDIQSSTVKNVKLLLVANKADTESSDRAVTKAEGKALAAQYGIDFYETSAKENINVDEAFTNLITQVYDEQKLQQQEKEKEKEKDNKSTITKGSGSSKNSTSSEGQSSNTIKLEKGTEKKKACCF